MYKLYTEKHPLDFELAQKRTQSYKTKSISLDYSEVIKSFDRGRPILKPVSLFFRLHKTTYEAHLNSFYLRSYSQYRHMWE